MRGGYQSKKGKVKKDIRKTPYKSNEVYECVVSKNHDQWLKERGHGIGGSDCSATMGLNPWMTNVELWQIKTGKKVRDEIHNTEAIDYGVLIEPYLRESLKFKYKNRFQVFYKPNAILINKEYPFMRYSPDGLIYDKVTDEWGIFEAKTTFIQSSKSMEKWHNQIPDNYLCQVLHGLNVTGFSFVWLRAELTYRLFNPSSDSPYNSTKIEIRDYYIRKDDDGCKDNMEAIKDSVIEFWEKYVATDKEPPLIITT